MAPVGVESVTRRYVPGTNVLETTFQSDTGEAKLTDAIPVHPHERPEQPLEVGAAHRIVRRLECASGSVRFEMECYPRFDYGTIVPHASLDGARQGFAHGGAAAISVYCSAPLAAEEDGFRAGGTLRSGEKLYASVTYQSQIAHRDTGKIRENVDAELADTARFWREWSERCNYRGDYRDEVVRSALTLKALTYAPSGGLVAAATTSLPEAIGGPRNWDYRFTWIRNATFALYALSIIGYAAEARSFKDWLEWSTLGRPRDLQIMYGLGGERRLTEVELPELEGYRRSHPVRVGNGAYSQFQLDIYGELLDSAHLYRKSGGEMDPECWEYLRGVVDYVMDHWREPDEGI